LLIKNIELEMPTFRRFEMVEHNEECLKKLDSNSKEIMFLVEGVQIITSCHSILYETHRLTH